MKDDTIDLRSPEYQQCLKMSVHIGNPCNDCLMLVAKNLSVILLCAKHGAHNHFIFFSIFPGRKADARCQKKIMRGEMYVYITNVRMVVWDA